MIFSPLFGPWNALDLALVLLLTAGLWTLQGVNARRRTRGLAPASARLRRNLLVFGVPLTLLAFDWLSTGRSAGALGLAIPVPPRGAAGLALAGVLIIGFALSTFFKWPRWSPEQERAALARLRESGFAPQTRGELAATVLLFLLIGCSAEILFRGFLVFAFAPLVGLWGAVTLAALTYGLGHGDATWKQTSGSLVSAFVFTSAYALTGSLYWLIVIHCFVGPFGIWVVHRHTSAPAPGVSAP